MCATCIFRLLGSPLFSFFRLLGSPRVMNQFPNLTGSPNLELIHLDRCFSFSTSKQRKRKKDKKQIRLTSTQTTNSFPLKPKPSRMCCIVSNHVLQKTALHTLDSQDQHRAGPRSTLQPSASPQDSVSVKIND